MINILKTIESYAYNITISIVILLAGFGLGMIVKKILQRILKELELNKIMAKVNVTYDLEKIISNIVSYVIYLFTVVLVLDQLGLKSVVLYLLVGAILMLIILTSLVGLKDVIPNFIGWLLIQKRSNIKEGYRIDIKEIYGVVERIGYLETEIRTERGDLLYVPNSLFMKSKFRIKKN
ncbi:mechanosensitive ion channel [Candidatus Woesearchaeota archaeon]|nr:mechanosensitive ion channel [Candidatus Woesearchaeota archaeon]